MDLGHLHLMLNHLPVLGAPALLALLAWGRYRRSPEVSRLALGLTVALGLVTALVYLTGEAAEELAERSPAFQEHWVERHEAIALWAALALGATALVALWALVRWRRPGSEPPGLAAVVLVGLLASTAVLGATAWTGGPIAHPELRPSSAAPAAEHEDGS